jgi:hypothetical protein
MRKEQNFIKAANKPLEIVVGGINLLLYVTIALLFISMIDIYFHDFPQEQYDKIDGSKSAFHVIFKFIFLLMKGIMLLSSKLMIHNKNTLIFTICLILSPIIYFLSHVIIYLFIYNSIRLFH